LARACGKKEKDQELFQQWDYFDFLGKKQMSGNTNIIYVYLLTFLFKKLNLEL
jgi:hypothetical protein